MQDRFKFRVWQTELKEPKMKYNSGLVINNNEIIEDGCVVMQCTGLKDKHGKLIYEGDIIYTPGWWWGAGFVHLNIGECGPCKGDSVMSYILAKNIDNPLKGAAHNIWNGAEVEVIGNIYENPELLEANND